MGFLAYIFAYSFIWLLHLFPGFLIYAVSDLLSLVTQYVVCYRKRVVRDNLTRAFPEYDLKRIRQIERRFYRHLSDLVLESALSHFLSEKKYLQKMRYLNPEVLDRYSEQGKQLIAVCGHYGNWEYLASLGAISNYQVVGTYRTLRNRHFDQMVKKNRERFSNITIPVNQMTRKMMQYRQQNQPVLTVILTDQRPMFHQIQYWTKFMGLDTPLYTGTERLARKMNAAVVFLKIEKVKRGRYEVELVPICDDPGQMGPNAITEAHVRLLEKEIREEPAYWLWSHRRWKHSYAKFIAEKEKKTTAEQG
jgi:KDO2-lipid IV(A) lauroyltransferase